MTDEFERPDYFAADGEVMHRLPSKVWAVGYRVVPEGKTRTQRVIMAFTQGARAKRQHAALAKLGVETSELLTGTITWEATE